MRIGAQAWAPIKRPGKGIHTWPGPGARGGLRPQVVGTRGLHGDDIWRGSCSTTAGGGAFLDSYESGIVIGNDDADAQGTDDEEDAKPPIYGLEGGLDVHSRSLGLGSRHGDILGADDGKRGGPEGSEEPFEATEATRRVIFLECSRVAPVPEPVGVVFGVPATHGHQGEGEEHEDENDLATGEPELGLAIGTHSEDIQETRGHTRRV